MVNKQEDNFKAAENARAAFDKAEAEADAAFDKAEADEEGARNSLFSRYPFSSRNQVRITNEATFKKAAPEAYANYTKARNEFRKAFNAAVANSVAAFNKAEAAGNYSQGYVADIWTSKARDANEAAFKEAAPESYADTKARDEIDAKLLKEGNEYRDAFNDAVANAEAAFKKAAPEAYVAYREVRHAEVRALFYESVQQAAWDKAEKEANDNEPVEPNDYDHYDPDDYIGDIYEKEQDESRYTSDDEDKHDAYDVEPNDDYAEDYASSSCDEPDEDADARRDVHEEAVGESIEIDYLIAEAIYMKAFEQARASFDDVIAKEATEPFIENPDEARTAFDKAVAEAEAVFKKASPEAYAAYRKERDSEARAAFDKAESDAHDVRYEADSRTDAALKKARYEAGYRGRANAALKKARAEAKAAYINAPADISDIFTEDDESSAAYDEAIAAAHAVYNKTIVEIPLYDAETDKVNEAAFDKAADIAREEAQAAYDGRHGESRCSLQKIRPGSLCRIQKIQGV